MRSTLTITQPDDWHVHFRDGEVLKQVVGYTAAQFARALVMPNLTPPVTTVEQAINYRQRIKKALRKDTSFDPKMSLYLTDTTTTDEVIKAAENPDILGFKLYPSGVTTNSHAGVTRITQLMSIFESMEKHNLALQIHAEVTDSHVDIFDREAVFIEQQMTMLHQEFPQLRMVLEHVTTKQGIDFVTQTNQNVVATITPQHILYNRNALFLGGLRPHMYCLPVLKKEQHRSAVIQAALSGNACFFLGTDSAPHNKTAKQSACGCAGIFSAPAALEIYANIFDKMGRLDLLEGFVSHHGADFYQLPRNKTKTKLIRKELNIPDQVGNGAEVFIPLCAGETLAWQIENRL